VLPLILFFDSESDRDRYMRDQLGSAYPVVQLRWARAMGCAWSCWHVTELRNYALRGVITHDVIKVVEQSVKSLSPGVYARLLLRWLPGDLFAMIDLLQREYAAEYARRYRARLLVVQASYIDDGGCDG